MAPVVREKSGSPENVEEKNDDEEEQNIWSTILKEVKSTSTKKLPWKKSLLVLGDNESGKTTLIAKLKGAADPKKGAGMEYFYLDVRDEYREDHTRLGVYILDGEASHSHLLQFSLSEKNFVNCMVMLCVPMTQPWNVMDSLNTWANILHDHVDQLRITSEQRREWKQKVVKRWQDYIEPGDELEAAATQLRRTATISGSSVDEEAPALPLPEDVLTVNLGLDIIVVITKTDFMSTLEKEHDYKDEHFDFIQQCIRRFCLQYGASLFYTSVKEDKNCDLLYKYLVHRIYGFPFHTPALVVEKDAVFIPSGWDNEKKISILHENMTSMRPDDFFSDVIVKPANIIRRLVQRDSEIQAEDEQVFLAKQQSLLNQQMPPAGTPRQESPIRTPPGVQKTPDRRPSGPPGVSPNSMGTPKKADGTKGAATTSEGVLANFFNSLLSKKTGNPSPGTMKMADKAAVRSDAAAELDRMTRTKKPPSQTSSPSTPNSNSSSPPS